MPTYSLLIALLVVFLDLFSIGLIFPIASIMLFDTQFPLLSADTSDQMRGIWLGILLVLLPFCEFFSAPLWGGASDAYGRKPPLLVSLGLAFVGYLIAVWGTYVVSLWIVLLSRVVIGFSSGNISIIQAAIADLSTPEQKAKRYGLLSMAMGAGFTLGPSVGGWLADDGYYVPFLFTALLVLINLIFAIFMFRETLTNRKSKKLSLFLGFQQLVLAFRLPGMGLIFLGSFLHNLGWSFFFEFIPIFLMKRFDFSSQTIGLFYSFSGGLWGLSTGLLIRPFVSRYPALRLFGIGNLMGALFILLYLTTTPFWLWFVMVPAYFFVSFCMPVATTYVSNHTAEAIQGEALGTLSSINAAAMCISPLFAGLLIGSHPDLVIWIGGGILIIAGAIVLLGSLRPKVAVD